MSRVRRRPASGPASSAFQAPRAALVVDSSIDDRPALAVVDEIDVHMIEPERQRNARP